MRNIILSVFIIGVTFVSSYGFAQEHHHAHVNDDDTKSLIAIMHGMNENLQKLSGAILFEDFPLITSSAHNIANHPGISKEDLHKLFERLGPKKEAFVKCDSAVHHLATEVSEAGTQENMDIIIEKYTAMIKKAVECHKEYKPKIKTESTK